MGLRPRCHFASGLQTSSVSFGRTVELPLAVNALNDTYR
jgi:hypothetical protein